MLARSGIQLHLGKTRVWNRTGVEAPGMAELGSGIWSPHGVKILGTPVGDAAFVSQLANERLRDERRLWESIPAVRDLQCSWQILLLSASPRFNHSARTLPPSLAGEYARGHDAGIWATTQAVLETKLSSEAHALTSLPTAHPRVAKAAACRRTLN